MTMITVHTSYHAQHRQARRNISDADVSFVLEHGQRIHTGGAMHVFLGRRNLPGERETYQRHAHLQGTVLVFQMVDDRLVLLTVYRNRHALKSIRAKPRFNRQLVG